MTNQSKTRGDSGWSTQACYKDGRSDSRNPRRVTFKWWTPEETIRQHMRCMGNADGPCSREEENQSSVCDRTLPTLSMWMLDVSGI
jgi:hypothetical protein